MHKTKSTMKKSVVFAILCFFTTVSLFGCKINFDATAVAGINVSIINSMTTNMAQKPLVAEGEEGNETGEDNTVDETEKEIIEEAVEEVDVSEEETIPTENNGEETDYTYEDDEEALTQTQRNSVNMLNYMAYLTQRINASKGNQLFLETAYSSLYNDTLPDSVDKQTQAQMNNLMDTIQNYRMISVKRDRLAFIYEQNRAQAMRKAIPNPLGLLSVVQSGNPLKIAASVLYMAVDSASSYSVATSQADLQFIKDGWELDDAEAAELHNSTKNMFNYMLNMVREYELPGDYALNQESIEKFVQWSNKPDSQIANKIAWLEAAAQYKTYKEFGPYWLELAKDYYLAGQYDKCLDAVNQYEAITTRIFRKDTNYAKVLPMAIVAAKESKTISDAEYIELADRYCALIMDNIKEADWGLSYFVAQVYLDLCRLTKDDSYIDKAYTIAFDNVTVLVDEQKELNAAYLSPVQKVEAGKGATSREKEEVKRYNKLIDKERDTALPPVSEALYLNCDLLFALADRRNISAAERKTIESIIHENGERIFLTKTLDAQFWFNRKPAGDAASDIDLSFNGEKITMPAIYVTDRSAISVTVTNENGTTVIDDWVVSKVKRPKKAGVDEFIVTYESKTADKYKYVGGETIEITIVPVVETPEVTLSFTYKTVSVKKFGFVPSIDFVKAE